MTREYRYRQVEMPELEAFLAGYVALCKRHGMRLEQGEYDYDGGTYTTIAKDNGEVPYLNLDYADSDLPFIKRAEEEIAKERHAEESAEAAKLARLEAEAPADAVVALEGLLRHMPTGHWSDELFAAKAAAKKVLAANRKP